MYCILFIYYMYKLITSFPSLFIIFLYCGQKGQLYELLFFQNNELIQQFMLQDENKVIVNNLPSIAVRSCGPGRRKGGRSGTSRF
jgi:hypothetical protein